MGKFFVSEHPLVQHKITKLRNKETATKEFREIVSEISTILFYEATRELPLIDVEVETPIEKCTSKTLDAKFVIVPILRAGLGMEPAILSIVPTAKVGHIGLYRDPETFMPIEYYCKLPEGLEESEVFVLDPMLATGGTTEAAISFIKDRKAKNITLLSIIAAPEGVKEISEKHPDVSIYTAAYDRCLNEDAFIVPGLGDAGDRIFGTK